MIYYSRLNFILVPLIVVQYCLLLAPYSLHGQSCGPKVSPRLLREIPCDMSTTAYCIQPGSAYPWSAVRRYIYENQGFMKRMYGEYRQSQVIREEIHRMNDLYTTFDLTTFRDGKSSSNNEIPLDSTNGTFKTEYDTNNVTVNETTNTNMVGDTEKSIVPSNDSELNEEIMTSTSTSTVSDNTVNSFASSFYFDDDTVADDVVMSRDNPGTTPTALSLTAPDSENSVPVEEPSKVSKGYNACPITQEVVAPYWANNTRGETLALLNVYPFEQYIHWEKCAFEGEQMLCREGCRCEQQYRLHRLLAFDPKNECRGIFADWFRFPGCCVCICYDNHERTNNRKSRL